MKPTPMRFITPTILAACALGSALAAFAAAGQEAGPGSGMQPLRPVGGPQEPLLPGGGEALRPAAPAQDAPAAQAQPIDWDLRIRTELTQLDLDARMECFDELREAAARDRDARRAMETISKDGADPDLAFLARLALREPARAAGRSGSPFARRPRTLTPRGGVSIDPFGGSSIFEIFENDPFFRGGIGGGLRGGDPFEDMRRQFEEMRRQHEDMRKRVLGGASPFGPGTGRSIGSSSMSFEMTPDGVKVTITEDDGSGPVEKVYEAPSKEALLEAHPELRERIR